MTWRASLTIQTCFSGSYGLMRTLCGPPPSGPGFGASNSESHCVHDSICFPFRSTTTTQLRNSAFGSVARWPSDPHVPLKPRPSVSGNFSSPRATMKMRSGDCAKIPGWDPQM